MQTSRVSASAIRSCWHDSNGFLLRIQNLLHFRPIHVHPLRELLRLRQSNLGLLPRTVPIGVGNLLGGHATEPVSGWRSGRLPRPLRR